MPAKYLGVILISSHQYSRLHGSDLTAKYVVNWGDLKLKTHTLQALQKDLHMSKDLCFQLMFQEINLYQIS